MNMYNFVTIRVFVLELSEGKNIAASPQSVFGKAFYVYCVTYQIISTR